MKLLLPWLCVLGLLIGLGWVYSTGQKKEAEMAALREESQQLQQVRAELEQVKNAGAQATNDELTRLRKEHEELLRLRNEARQLRSDKQQLSSQVQTAQAQAQSAQEQVQALRATPGQPVPAAARCRRPAPSARATACPPEYRAGSAQRLHQQPTDD